MWSVSWFRDQFGDAALAAAARDGRPTEGRSIEALLGEEAARVPAGSDGLLTVHDWAAPPQAPFRKGAMIGFDGRHTRAHLYRSVLEGIALRLKNHMDPMAAELDQPFVELVVSGGGANSDLMMQILADVHGVPTRRNRRRSSASIGCAVNAGLFAGVWSTAEEATGVLVEPDDTFDPNPAHAETYRLLADVESGVHSHLDPITRRLNDQPLR
jgi:sugar (pentulose or hexulose) kinase